jgi:hypothetical protein
MKQFASSTASIYTKMAFSYACNFNNLQKFQAEENGTDFLFYFVFPDSIFLKTWSNFLSFHGLK